MEKKTISVHAVTIHVYTIIIALLMVIIAIMCLKYLHLKFAVHGFTESAMMMNAEEHPMATVADYANIVATTVVNFPQIQPMYGQPVVLQNYIATLSKQLHRDVVVMDTNRKILADTVAANVGSQYTADSGKEVEQTLKDGVSRSFEEVSVDYPTGVSEVAVAMKDANNNIVGVVLVSNTAVGK